MTRGVSNTYWIDVSVRLRHGLVPRPGDAPFELKRVSDLARGDLCTFSTLSMSAHAGTHVDAPLHFVKGGRSVDALPLEATVGPARVILIRNPRVITADEIRSHGVRPGERVLFKTRNSASGQPGVFFKRYVHWHLTRQNIWRRVASVRSELTDHRLRRPTAMWRRLTAFSFVRASGSSNGST